ncbi:hypothetical protein ACWDXD_33235 [Streptomyces sp. NPDC003314]
MPTTSRGYSYPAYTDLTNFPAQIQDLALDIDADVTANLQSGAAAALNMPSCRVARTSGSQAIANNTNVTLTYTTETYDSGAFFNIGTSATNLVVQTPGVYLLAGSVNIAPDGSATGAAALIMASSAGLVPNPIGVSRNLDNDKHTSLACTTLHYVPVAGEILTMLVRHNHGASLNAEIAQFTVTRIA